MHNNIPDHGTPKSMLASPAVALVSPHTSSSSRLLKKGVNNQGRVLCEQQSTDLPEVLGEKDKQRSRNRRHSRGFSNRALIEIQKTNVSFYYYTVHLFLLYFFATCCC